MILKRKWPYLILGVMVFGALLGASFVHQFLNNELEDSFQTQSLEIRNWVHVRMSSYIESLRGAEALFAASQEVTRDEWKTFTQIAGLSSHTGLQSFEYVERVLLTDVDAYIKRVRTAGEPGADGYPQFTIYPVESKSEFYPITYGEPENSNVHRLGYDVFSDPEAKMSLTEAAERSSVVSYLSRAAGQHTDEITTYLQIASPVYQNKIVPGKPDERLQNLKGFVVMAFRPEDFFKAIVKDKPHSENIYFKIYVSAPYLSGESAKSDRRLVFQSRSDEEGRPKYQFNSLLRLAGTEWRLEFYADRNFNWAPTVNALPLFVLVLGLAVSFLVFRYIVSIQGAENRAMSVVEGVSHELVTKQAYLEQLIKTAPDPLITLDMLGFIRDANPAVESVSGYPPKEIIGKHFAQIGIIMDSSIPKVLQEFALVVAGQVRPPFELTIRSKSGQAMIVEAHSRKVDLDQGGSRIQTIIRDITDRKKAETNLKAFQEHLNMALKSAHMGAWTWDIQERVFIWDDFFDAFLLPINGKRECKIEDFLMLIQPEDRLRFEQEIQRALYGQGELNTEAHLTGQNQKICVMAFRGKIRRDDRDRPVNLTGILWDMTEKQKNQSQMMQAQKMETIGVFSGGIAHDFNNQLAPILGYLNLILKETKESDPVYAYLTEANQCAKRCVEIVQRLMNFSRPSTHKKDTVHLKPLLEETRKIISKVLPSTIRLKMEAEADLPPVLGNENELLTVFMNLCANARDAMPTGGNLTVSAKRAANPAPPDGTEIDDVSKTKAYVCITITDTGSGISPSEIQKIFEPFFTTKEKGKGTGLGLSMVYSIIRDHKGWIEVSSQLGKGTAFALYLPAAAGPDSTASKAGKKDSSEAAIPKWHGTVLFADDEEYMRRLGKIFLERLGFHVLFASDGIEAVEVYSAALGRIDFVVMDMTMPRQTGLDTLRKIKALDPKAKIIVASGFTGEATPEEIIRAGAVDFIQKPYTIWTLIQSIQKNIFPSA